jgi:hypothetical protein
MNLNIELFGLNLHFRTSVLTKIVSPSGKLSVELMSTPILMPTIGQAV